MLPIFFSFSFAISTVSYVAFVEQTLDLIEWTFKNTFKKEGMLYFACNDKKAFFTSTDHGGYKYCSCENELDAVSYLLDNIYI